MTPVWWMVGASVAAWGAVTAATGPRLHPELLWGLLGPLAAACGTWVVTARAFRVNPQALTAVMVAGLAVKAVFFGLYVVVMLRGLDLRPAPFVGSFTGFFVALYGMEALFLKRLFARGPGR
ncbi:MAG: hypothetical protein AB7P99_06470 [Vicinamibacterales bacterium]